MKQKTYIVGITCSWNEPIKANSMQEAIKKADILEQLCYERGIKLWIV